MKHAFAVVAALALIGCTGTDPTAGAAPARAAPVAVARRAASAAASRDPIVGFGSIVANGSALPRVDLTCFDQKVITAREAGTGAATGRRQYEPLLVRKYVDAASPLLFKALVENMKIDAAFVTFPRGCATSDCAVQTAIADGRVASIKQVAASTGAGLVEEITLVFHDISTTYAGTTFADTWSASR